MLPFSTAIVLVALSMLAPSMALAHTDGSFPRTMNVDWTNNPDAVRDSRYDMVALSPRATRAEFDSIKTLNPASVRLVTPGWYTYYYAGPSGYPQSSGPFETNDPYYGFDRRFWNLMNDNGWWCWSVDSVGTTYHATAFWNMWLGNLSVKCPPNAQGKRLCDVFADFLVDQLVTQKGADGVFFDQLWDSPRWLNGAMGGCQPGTSCTVETPGTKYRTWFDLDADNVADPPDSLDVWWHQGVEIVFAKLRQRMGAGFVIMGNGNHHYTTSNGAMYERFPRIFGQIDPPPNPYNYRWQDSMFGVDGYVSAWPTRFSGPVRTLLDTELAGGDRYVYPSTPVNQQLFRFNLGSALLGDGYIALNNGSFNCYYWQPEYDLPLGWPAGAPYSTMIGGVEIWRRSFTNGQVWVNAKGIDVPAGADNPQIKGWDAVITQTSGTIEPGPGAPPPITFARPQPNPMTQSGTMLTFTLSLGEPARLDVLDLRGRRVRSLWQGVGTGYAQFAIWDGKSDEGWIAPLGVYFARIDGYPGRASQQKLVRTH